MHVGTFEAGSRHDLRFRISPTLPTRVPSTITHDEGAFGYVHSYETASRDDGPGLRVVLFVSGCLLRCTSCHNPDTWHLKDGTRVAAQQILGRPAGFAPALQALEGGIAISGESRSCRRRGSEGHGPSYRDRDFGLHRRPGR